MLLLALEINVMFEHEYSLEQRISDEDGNKSSKKMNDNEVVSIKYTHLVRSWSAHTVKSTRTRMKNGTKTIIPFSDHRRMIAVLAIDPIIEYEPDRITWNLDESKRKYENMEQYV